MRLREFWRGTLGKCTRMSTHFCLADPPKGNAGKYTCPWLVGMSEKASGSVRIGCGYYDWSFESREPFLVDGLAITIKMMKVLVRQTPPPPGGWLPLSPSLAAFAARPRPPAPAPPAPGGVASSLPQAATDPLSTTTNKKLFVGSRKDDVRCGCAPCKGGAFQWVQAPPGNRSSRKQSEQSWR